MFYIIERVFDVWGNTRTKVPARGEMGVDRRRYARSAGHALAARPHESAEERAARLVGLLGVAFEFFGVELDREGKGMAVHLHRLGHAIGRPADDLDTLARTCDRLVVQ